MFWCISKSAIDTCALGKALPSPNRDSLLEMQEFTVVRIATAITAHSFKVG
jgi:hypothetical protein